MKPTLSDIAKAGGRVTGSLRRLARNKAGNSFILIAASLIPIAGVIGGGLDMGRAYLSKSKLQSACDAGALAGRKSMVAGVWNMTAIDAANSYFNINFANGKYGSTGLTKSFGSTDGQTVRGQATANVPTTLMKIFGFSQVNLSVTCEAVLNLPNTDVMFVLDTTGSMTSINPGDSSNRIVGLRGAVKSFYTQVEAAKGTSGTQIRYGFLPYSQTVNVGALLKPEWIDDKWRAQSRVPAGIETSSDAGGSVTTNYTYQDYAYPGTSYPSPTISQLPLENCVAPSSTYTSDQTTLSETSSPWPGPPAGTRWERRFRQVYAGTYYSLSHSSTLCELYTYDFTGYIQEFTQISVPAYTTAYSSNKYMWDYKQVSYDTSMLMVGGSISTNTGYQHGAYDAVWNGCIEERATFPSSSYDPIPMLAYDMQIDKIPTASPLTQWGPYVPGLIWSRRSIGDWDRATYHSEWDTDHYATSPRSVCPTAARKLSAISSSDLDSYLASLVPAGNTHHDIGMIWGARLLSPTGLFAAENTTSSNGGSITRHIIFMTDGETHTSVDDYDAYGVNALDRRRLIDIFTTPTNASSDAEVELRFKAMCNEVKRRGITIWVIAFGTDLTSMLETCASGTDHAFEASNTAALNTAFSDIAGKIANLRLKN